MSDYHGKVAVITGAASGIGQGIAEHCAGLGMRVVMLDCDIQKLSEASERVFELGARVLAIHADVRDFAQMQDAAEQVYEQFGAVHLLVNNAGVAGGLSAWETSHAEWRRVLDINLMGVIHGVQAFVPRMLGQGVPAQIVNTASIAGLTSFHPSAPYLVAKHAVVALSEQMRAQFMQQGASIGVAVLCPSWVRTAIMEPMLDNPELLAAQPRLRYFADKVRQAPVGPAEAAEALFRGLEKGRFYILTGNDAVPMVKARLDAVARDVDPWGLPEVSPEAGAVAADIELSDEIHAFLQSYVESMVGHDLDAVLAHYDEDFSLQGRGKAWLKSWMQYWQPVLAQYHLRVKGLVPVSEDRMVIYATLRHSFGEGALADGYQIILRDGRWYWYGVPAPTSSVAEV